MIHLKAGDEAAANASATIALERLADDTPLPLRLELGDLMRKLKRPADALAAVCAAVSPDNYEIVGRAALAAAHSCGDLRFILDYTKSLREAGRWYADAVELEVETLRQYREFEQAVAVCRDFIQRTEYDKDRRLTKLRLSLIGLESGRPELIERDPDQLPRLDEIGPHLAKVLCAVLEQGSIPGRAAEVAYELVRRNYNSHEAHRALCAAVGIGRTDADGIPEPSTVAAGTAVRFRIEGEETSRWIVIEDGPNPEPARHEFPPEHHLCAELLNKKKGDRFIDRANPYQERPGVIEEVTSKFRFRAWDSVTRWTDLFHDVPFVFVFNVARPEDERPDFGPILRALEAQEQDEESLRGWYRDHPVSLLMMAVASHRHPCQIIRYLGAHPDLPIRCCIGNEEDYALGRNCTCAPALVADPSALSTLFVTDLWRRIERLPFKLIVTRSAVDEFLRQAEELRHSSGDRLARQGNELVRLTIQPEDRERTVRTFEEFVNWLRSVAEVRSGLALADLPKTRRKELTTLFGQSAAESIATALEQRVPLWTDDSVVPVAMSPGQPAPRTWTQLVGERLRSERCITDDQFVELLMLLIAMGYQHTQCVPEVLLRASEQSDWNPEHRPLSDVLRWLGNGNIQEDGVIGVVILGLRLIWRNAMFVHQREGVTRGLSRALAGRPNGRELVVGIAANTRRMFPVEPHLADQCRQCLLDGLTDLGRSNQNLIIPPHRDPT